MCRVELCAYPEVNLQIAAASKLPIADLERDRHLVILVEVLVEAFPRMRAHLDVVAEGDPEQAGQSGAARGEREAHRDDNGLLWQPSKSVGVGL